MAAGSRIIFFDGQCPFCVGWIKFLLDRDADNRLRFASLQSDWTRQFMEDRALHPPRMDSVLVWDGQELLDRSEAAVSIAEALPGIWHMGKLVRHVPLKIRNSLYDFIAERRTDWFGKSSSCWVPKDPYRQKFLDLSDPVYENS